MPVKSGTFTPKEQRFVEVFARTGDRKEAERRAGYRPNGGYQVLARPEILARITAEQEARLVHDLLPLSVDVVEEILRNTKAPASARLTAAKMVQDRAWPERKAEDGRDDHEKSAAELAAEITRLEGIAAEKARDVSSPSDRSESSPFD